MAILIGNLKWRFTQAILIGVIVAGAFFSSGFTHQAVFAFTVTASCPEGYAPAVSNMSTCLPLSSGFCERLTGSGAILDEALCSCREAVTDVDDCSNSDETPDGCTADNQPFVPYTASVSCSDYDQDGYIVALVRGGYCPKVEQCFYNGKCYSPGEKFEELEEYFEGGGTDTNQNIRLDYPGECNCSADRPDLPEDGDEPSLGPTPAVLTCEQICADETPDLVQTCMACVCPEGVDTISDNVWTELGCITATQEGITIAVMRVFIGIITGLAVIRFVQAGFMFNTDEPEKIKEAKGIVASAITALVFGAILPVLLNFIGIDILGIGELINLG